MIPVFNCQIRENKNLIVYDIGEMKQLLSYSIGGNVSKTTAF